MKLLIFSVMALAARPSPLGVVRRSDLKQVVTVAGSVMPNRRTVITPAFNAYVRKLYVKIGDKVAIGQPLVSLSQTLKSTHEEIHPIRAPFAGTVVQVSRAEGEYMETGKEDSAILRVDDLSRLFIYCDVPESDIAKIRPGQRVYIKANAILSRAYEGAIREIALAAKEKKGGWGRPGDRVEFEVRVEITDKDAAIRPGMSTIVDIITDERSQVLALPHEYVEKKGDRYEVTLENGEKRPVDVGLQNQEVFEILRGLKENDRVKMVDFFSIRPEG